MSNRSIGRGNERGAAWPRPLYWMWGFVRGFLAAAAGPAEEQRREAAQRWKGRWQRWVLQMVDPAGPGQADFPGAASVEPLRDTLVGRPKGEVAAMLGPPPATSAQPIQGKAGTYWYAETWYYPLDQPRHHAIAITFANDVVRSVEHLVGPGI